jgi:hypothetical protein
MDIEVNKRDLAVFLYLVQIYGQQESVFGCVRVRRNRLDFGHEEMFHMQSHL